MNLQTLHDQLSIRLFLQTLQQQYAEALARNDLAAMTEASGALSIAYSSLENHALAKRWADAFWDAWYTR
jgi:hypothetical protein